MLGSQVSSHQYTVLQQGRREKADSDFRCHKIYCAWIGVAQTSRLQHTEQKRVFYSSCITKASEITLRGQQYNRQIGWI